MNMLGKTLVPIQKVGQDNKTKERENRFNLKGSGKCQNKETNLKIFKNKNKNLKTKQKRGGIKNKESRGL